MVVLNESLPARLAEIPPCTVISHTGHDHECPAYLVPFLIAILYISLGFMRYIVLEIESDVPQLTRLPELVVTPFR